MKGKIWRFEKSQQSSWLFLFGNLTQKNPGNATARPDFFMLKI